MGKSENKQIIVISLIGMSCSGKSRWSKKLAEKGFDRICCDDLIEKYLSAEFKKIKAHGIQDVALWMGHPFEKHFQKNQALYLDAEKKAMKKILEKLKKGVKKDTVVDTTGSLIYAGNSIMKELRKYSLVIYLETPVSMLPEMLRRFIKKPRPLVWKNMFVRRKGETNEQALIRCYPKLLRYRRKIYKDNAEVILKEKVRRAPDFTEEKFIEFARKASCKRGRI